MEKLLSECNLYRFAGGSALVFSPSKGLEKAYENLESVEYHCGIVLLELAERQEHTASLLDVITTDSVIERPYNVILHPHPLNPEVEETTTDLTFRLDDGGVCILRVR